jgi:hypothetical protein
VPPSASLRQSGVVLGLARIGIRIVGLRRRDFLPYRPLPFLGVIGGQMGQMSGVRSLANPLV